VNEVAARSGLSHVSTFALRIHWVNAVAVARPPSILATDGALETLDDAELEAICAHEVAHLRESRTHLARRLLGAAVLLPLIPSKILMAYSPPAWCVLLGLGLWLLRGHRAWERRMEARADLGARDLGVDPIIYARALEKGYAANLIPAVLPSPGTHPNLPDRQESVGATPASHNPAKVPVWRVLAGLVIALVIATGGQRLLGMSFAAVLSGMPEARAWLPATAPRTATVASLLDEALQRYNANNRAAALALARRVPADAPDGPDALAFTAQVEAEGGDCDAAARALQEALSLHRRRGRELENCGWIKDARAQQVLCLHRRERQRHAPSPSPASTPADERGAAP
jgi:hypothetical protein